MPGVDLSGAMLELCRQAVPAAGPADVRLTRDDASAADRPAASFDVLTSSLVLFFLPDPARAARSWHRLAAPRAARAVDVRPSRTGVGARRRRLHPSLPAAMLDARASGASGPFRHR